jgi:hypothetical protein
LKERETSFIAFKAFAIAYKKGLMFHNNNFGGMKTKKERGEGWGTRSENSKKNLGICKKIS